MCWVGSFHLPVAGSPTDCAHAEAECERRKSRIQVNVTDLMSQAANPSEHLIKTIV